MPGQGLAHVDATTALKKVKFPVLALNGENDIQVKAKRNLVRRLPPPSHP
jgi:hypothetical protein